MQARYVFMGLFVLLGISILNGCTYVIPPPPGYAMDMVQPSAWHAHYCSPEVRAVYDTETDRWYSSENDECQVCRRNRQDSPYQGGYPIRELDNRDRKILYDQLAQMRARSTSTRRGWCVVPGIRMPWLPLDFSVKRPVRFVCVTPLGD